MKPSRSVLPQLVLLVVAALGLACGSKTFRQGQSAAKKGDWDLAVARFAA